MIATGTVHAEPHQYIESPSFRVNFWSRQSLGHAWALDAFVLTEVADVTEVVQWADEHADGRRVEVFAEFPNEPVGSFTEPRQSNLLRLLGSDPNEGVRYDIVFQPS
jgi:hypothetical protein